MRVAVLQENLAKGINQVSRMVATKAQLPVLNNVLLATDKGKLKLSATNLETGMNLWLGGKVEKEGKITIPARVLTETVITLPPETVILETEADKLKLTCAKFKAVMNGIAAEEFPIIPSLKGKKPSDNVLELEREVIESGVNQVAMAAATDESRPIFTGVKLEINQNRLRLAATDGYRLSVKVIDGIKGLKQPRSLIVPARALVELVRGLSGLETELKKIVLAATDEERQMIMAGEDLEIVTRLLEGEFPDFDKIIPKTSTTTAEIDREEWLQAVRAAAVFARDSANIVRFKIGKSQVLVSANSPHIGENEVELTAKTTGEAIEIAFNSRYLLDALGVMKADVVRLGLSGPLSPGVFRPLGDESFVHLIMPVRVQA